MPNRMQRRKTKKLAEAQGRKTFTLLDFQKALAIALDMRKASKGHLFSKLKINKENNVEMCVFCDQDRTTDKYCEYNELTLFDRIQTILINRDFFSDNDIEAIWLQHSAEYAHIQIPVLKDDDGKEA